jgi:serine/threonine protein kinase
MNAIPANILCAAEFLEGTVFNGWVVTKRVPKDKNSTGGHFSIPYFVEKREGGKTKHAFLKALNFGQIAASSDFSKVAEQYMAAFNFERDTLSLCKDKGLTRIASLLDAGEFRGPNNDYPIPICYIIFELARGDARKEIARFEAFNLAWTLRTLHQTAVALNQLHTHGIAHQDLKPSNILFFEAFGVKIGDLGCADLLKKPSKSPRGHLAVAGEMTYAPPELLYDEVSHDWKIRRLGADLYMLGSLVIFFLTGGVSITPLLLSKLNQDHKPHFWPHDYRLALPYVRDAFEHALEEVKPSVPTEIQTDIFTIVRYLCEPDPRRRGHPNNPKGEQHNLQRFVSAFNLLATTAEYGLLKLYKHGRK